jgi:uncharacterized membrane protein YraQ (UPF0718 family)/copper chaperone CopZ
VLDAMWTVLLELAPWLLVGAAFAGVLHVVLPNDFVRRHLRGRGGVLKAVAIGVPLPLCSCGVIPAGLGLKRDGASDGATVGFMIATPQTGVDSVMVSAGMLGWPFALFKLFSATVTGLVGGWLADATVPSVDASTRADDAASTPSKPRTVRGGLDHALDVLRSIWRWIVVGVVVSAAITTFVPSHWLTGVAAHGEILALLLALAISLPAYVCATASVPIAAALVASGLPPGAALVFLMAGPATNVATLGAVYRALGRRALVVYLGTIVGGSLLFGWAFGSVVPTAGMLAPHDHAHASWISIASAVGLVAMLGWFAVDDVRTWWGRRERPRREETLVIPIAGMTCNGCVRRVEKALLADPRVHSTRVDLAHARAEVHGTIEGAAARELIRAAGFTPQ